MTVPTITALPTAPSRASPSTFSTTADTWVAALPTWTTEANALGAFCETQAVNADASATASEASAAAAALSEDAAASAANFAGVWSTLTGPLNIPASVYHSSQFWILLNNLADVTTSEPGVTSDWLRAPGQVNVRVTATGVTAASGDHVYLTAAGQTVTLPATAVAGDWVAVSVGAFADTVIGRNGLKIMALSENIALDVINTTTTLRYIDTARGWVIV